MKKIPILIALLVILIAGGGGYLLAKNAKLGGNIIPQTKKSNQQKDQGNIFSGSLQDLISRGKASKCTYSGQDDEDQEFSGVIYVANKKARQDSEFMQNGQNQEMHLIVDDKTVYMWTSMEPNKGVKMELDMSDQEVEDIGGNINEYYQGQDLQKEYNYKCSSWKADSSKFVPPSNVEFVDLSEMMKKMKEQMGGAAEQMQEAAEEAEQQQPSSEQMDQVKEMMCQACDQAPDPAECRENLGCK